MSTRHEAARSEASISAKPISDARCLNSAWEVYKLVHSSRSAGEELKMTAIARIIAKHYRELEDAAVAARDALKEAKDNSRGFIATTGPDTDTMPIIDSALDALNKALGGTP